MPSSVLFKNCGDSGLFKNLVWVEFLLPPEDDDAVATAQNTTSAHATTGATYTDATKTLTKTGFFAGYVFTPGDRITVVTGTGITATEARIASKTSNNAIVLLDDIGADSVDVAFTLQTGKLWLDGAFVKPYGDAGANILFPYPCSVHFTFSASTDVGTLYIDGQDQFGDDLTFVCLKATGSTVLKASAANGARVPCFSFIRTIRMDFSTAAGTVKAGFNYSAGTSNTVPLPLRLPTVAGIKGVYFDTVDGAWGTATAINGAKSNGYVTMTSTEPFDSKAAAIAVATGLTGAHATTAATWTQATKTLTKTGFFASYTPRAGDVITAITGTGITATSAHIAHKVDSNSVILVEDIGVDAADVAFTLTQPTLVSSRGRILLVRDQVKAA